MFYLNICRKKSFIIGFILIITFLSLSIRTNAQSKDRLDTIHIPNVTVSAPRNTSKYLWNLLKNSYKNSIKDSILYYSIEFSIAAPDSSYYEMFKGVILIEFKNSKNSAFLCKGNYEECDKANSTLISYTLNDLWKKTKIENYNRFKKYEINYNNTLDTFNITKNNEKLKTRTTSYVFKNKILKSKISYISNKQKILGYILNYDYTVNHYEYFNNALILKKLSVLMSYSYKNSEKLLKINLLSIPNNDYTPKVEINNETPSSLFQKLNIHNKR
jgi:hypothetical protein